jgi:hypothetical protein
MSDYQVKSAVAGRNAIGMALFWRFYVHREFLKKTLVSVCYHRWDKMDNN